MDDEVVLEILQRGVTLTLQDKFFKIDGAIESDIGFRTKVIGMIGTSLGEVIDGITFPKNWERLLNTKKCPKYMKEMITYNIETYYPTIKLPDKSHWMTFTRAGEENYDNLH